MITKTSVYFYLSIVVAMISMSGCQTTSKAENPPENKEDVKEVLSAVAGALSGKTLSEKELKNLENQIRTDKEAQSAIEAITDSVGRKSPVVKYCPVTGRRYAAHIENCPEHQVLLEVVGQ